MLTKEIKNVSIKLNDKRREIEMIIKDLSKDVVIGAHRKLMNAVNKNGGKNMLNVFINKRMVTVNQFRAMRSAIKGEDDSKILYYFGGVPVYLSDQFLQMNMAVIAAYGKDLFERDIIVVDSHFMRLEEDVQLFILAHELGHSKDEEINTKGGILGFIKTQIMRQLNSIIGEVSREESFADIYASHAIGPDKALKALNKMQDIMGRYKYRGRCKEIDLRIETIEWLIEDDAYSDENIIFKSLKGGE